jgi:hypothetical protein
VDSVGDLDLDGTITHGVFMEALVTTMGMEVYMDQDMVIHTADLEIITDIMDIMVTEEDTETGTEIAEIEMTKVHDAK